MSGVYFVSDLHLGHRSILRHTAAQPGAYRGGTTIAEHDHWVIQQLLSVGASKRNFWWILGDVAMDIEQLKLLDTVPGRKVLVLGNHDRLDSNVYLKYFERLCGTIKRYNLWLSHVPIHPVEFRGLPLNVHGHSHDHPLRGDPRYVNVSIEWLPNNRPLSLDNIRAKLNTTAL